MYSDEMIKRIKSGEPLIDIAIDKWKDIANGTGYCLGNFNCALCYVYIHDKCDNCPIYKFTGYRGCRNTPFGDFRSHHAEKHVNVENRNEPKCDICKSIANVEIAFLETVRYYLNNNRL